VGKLATADRVLGAGKDVADVWGERAISEPTSSRWRNQIGGSKADAARRLRDLEREHAALRRLLADTELDKAARTEIVRGTCSARNAGGRGVAHRIRVVGVGERFACRVTGQHPTTQPRPPTPTAPADPDAALGDWLQAWAKEHPRRGCRNADRDARDEGWHVNHNKLQRRWREEGLRLRVPQQRRRTRLGTSTTPNPPKADAPNRVWAVGFPLDATTDGRPVTVVSIVDEPTRQCLGGLVERSSPGGDLLDEQDRIAAGCSDPAVLACDHGPELACQAWPSGPG
jgi:putative transposase